MSDWQQVQTLFLDSIDLSPAERRRLLDARCESDPWLRAEVETLLAADDDSGETIEAAVQEATIGLFDTQSLEGQRLGIYRVVREIGRGGMGSVYLATRDDAEYRKQVAVKVVRRGMDTADALERFRYERQILANLEHPNIARLLDGGTTSQGMPFLVMEYIEGRPVDAFCREQALSYDQICRLFLEILGAISYAHRNLVVHRDLKPANILITVEGTPKLLDFGVAKIVGGDPDAMHTVDAAIRPFTPEYASPEQVQGIPITTSSDIYSLGTILYELLIDKRAQRIEPHTPSQIERVICHTEVPHPRLAAPGLSPDLDNIVMMALRKDPERRYQSAGQFAEDIRRYLDGRPVIARPESVLYNCTKFVQRNRLQVAGAGVVAASLIGGLAVSIAQTRHADRSLVIAESQRKIAEHETQLAQAASVNEARQKALAEQQKATAEEQRRLADLQRDEAQRQKALADQRLDEISGLADKAFFDVHDSIAELPGSMPARQKLVKTTLDYLTVIEHQPGLTDQMREALCAAYFRLSQIQGNPTGASMQDFPAAEASLLKAQELIKPVLQRSPNDSGYMMRWIEVRAGLADLYLHTDRGREGEQAYLDLIPVTQRMKRNKDCDANCDNQEAAIETAIAHNYVASNPELSLQHAERGIALEQAILVKYPGDLNIRQGLGVLAASAAGAEANAGNLEKAAELYRSSIAVREGLLKDNPTSNQLRRNLLVAYGNYTTVLGIPTVPNLGRYDEARTMASKGVALARLTVAGDPQDVTARHDLGMILSRWGMIEPAPGGAAESLEHLQESAALLEPILAANPKSAETASQLADVLRASGHRQESLAQTDQAQALYRRSIDVLEPFLAVNSPGVVIGRIRSEQDLAMLHAAAGRTGDALDMAGRALAQAKQYCGESPTADPKKVTLASAWYAMARVTSATGDSSRAKESAAAALRLWNSASNPGILTPYRKQMAEMQVLAESSSL